MTVARVSIGQLARRCGLTAKALRHYDRLGLLTPTAVDPATGYRWYSVEQIETARVIARLRAVDLPLLEVRACLSADEAEVRRRLLVHRRRLDARRTRLTGALHTLDHLLADGRLPTMTDPDPTPDGNPTGIDERRLAADLFNGVWRLMEDEKRTPADDDRMLHMAHASRYHWGQVGAPVNLARGEWLCSRVYAVLRRAEPSRHHAERVLALCHEHGIGDWDLAFGYEALARAYAVAGDTAEAQRVVEQARAATEDIADDDDRQLVLADLDTIPR